MPNISLDANKITYSLLTIIVFLCGYIVSSFMENNQQIMVKQDEINAQLQKINIQLVEIRKDIITRNEIIEIVTDELIKAGVKQ